ncbi:MAG: hypothetical protein Q9222_000311 [Ikaeria aurantiellina]
MDVDNRNTQATISPSGKQAISIPSATEGGLRSSGFVSPSADYAKNSHQKTDSTPLLSTPKQRQQDTPFSKSKNRTPRGRHSHSSNASSQRRRRRKAHKNPRLESRSPLASRTPTLRSFRIRDRAKDSQKSTPKTPNTSILIKTPSRSSIQPQDKVWRSSPPQRRPEPQSEKRGFSRSAPASTNDMGFMTNDRQDHSASNMINSFPDLHAFGGVHVPGPSLHAAEIAPVAESDPAFHVPSRRSQPAREAKILPSIEQSNDPRDPKRCAFSWCDLRVQNGGSPHQCAQELSKHKLRHDEESDSDISFMPRDPTVISESEYTPVPRRPNARKRKRTLHDTQSARSNIESPVSAHKKEDDSSDRIARVKRELTECVEVASSRAFPDRDWNRTDSVMPGNATDFVSGGFKSLRGQIREMRQLLLEQQGVLEATKKERDEWFTKAKTAMDAALKNILGGARAQDDVPTGSQVDRPCHVDVSPHPSKPVEHADWQLAGSSNSMTSSKPTQVITQSREIDTSPARDSITGIDRDRQSRATIDNQTLQNRRDESSSQSCAVSSKDAEIDVRAQPEEISVPKSSLSHDRDQWHEACNKGKTNFAPAFSEQRQIEGFDNAGAQDAEREPQPPKQLTPQSSPTGRVRSGEKDTDPNLARPDTHTGMPVTRREWSEDQRELACQQSKSPCPTRQTDVRERSKSKKRKKREKERGLRALEQSAQQERGKGKKRKRSALVESEDVNPDTDGQGRDKSPRGIDFARESTELSELPDLNTILKGKNFRSSPPRLTPVAANTVGRASAEASSACDDGRQKASPSHHIDIKGATSSKTSSIVQQQQGTLVDKGNPVVEQSLRSKSPKAGRTDPKQASHTRQKGIRNGSAVKKYTNKVPQTRTWNTEKVYRECLIPQKDLSFWQSQCVCQELPDYFVDAANREPRLETWPWGREQFLVHCLQIVECPGHLDVTQRKCKEILDDARRQFQSNQSGEDLDREIEEGIAIANRFLADGNGEGSSTSTAAQSLRREHSTIPPRIWYDKIPRFRYPPTLPPSPKPNASSGQISCSEAPVEKGTATRTAKSPERQMITSGAHGQCNAATKVSQKHTQNVHKARKPKQLRTALPTPVASSSPNPDRSCYGDIPTGSMHASTAGTDSVPFGIEEPATPPSSPTSRFEVPPKNGKSKSKKNKSRLSLSAKSPNAQGVAPNMASASLTTEAMVDKDRAIPSTEQHDVENIGMDSSSQAGLNVTSIYRRHDTEPVHAARPMSPATAVKRATAQLFRQPLFATVGPVIPQRTDCGGAVAAPPVSPTSSDTKRRVSKPTEVKEYYSRHVPDGKRKNDWEINHAGRLPLGYDRHISAPYAYNKKGKLFKAYEHIADMKGPDGEYLWDEIQKRRSRMKSTSK